MGYEIKEYLNYSEDEILPLYRAVGWTNYTDRPGLLKQAFGASLLTLGAYDGDRLIGILRAVGDGCSVVFVQDLLVLPEYQRKGIGTALMKALLTRSPDVYQLELMTDDTEKTRAFYQSLGLRDAAEMGCAAFIRM